MTREEKLDWLYRLKSEIFVFMPKEWLIPMADALDDAIKALEQEPTTFQWCHDCKEYDQEKHCCHRWSKVIRNTVEEMKQEQEPRWILVSEKLPQNYEDVLVSGVNIVKQAQFIKGVFECESDGIYGLLNDEKVINAEFTFKALAWMPLPKPYKAESEET